MIANGNTARLYSWQHNTKRKTDTENRNIKGFVNSNFFVIVLLIIAAAVYLYSINSSAVKGYQIRQAEKKVLELRKENENLKIKEAELKSLYHIEESSRNLNMESLKNVSYIQETGPMAMK